MNGYELEYKLDRAIGALTPDVATSLAVDAPDYRTQAGEMVVPSYPQKKGKKRLYTTMAMAACGALAVGVMGFDAFFAVHSVVEIDVNPSIALSLNKGEKVLQATGLNQEGRDLLADVKVESLPLDQAIDGIMGELVTQGYLSAEKNAVLITVENDQETQRLAIQETATTATQTALRQVDITPSVLTQGTTTTKDAGAQALSEKLGISYSKALLLLELTQNQPSLSLEALAAMTIDEICDYYDDLLDDLEDHYQDDHPMEDTLDELDDLLGDVEDKVEEKVSTTSGTITPDEAKAIALGHVGASQVSQYEWELDDGQYEIEFIVGKTEYEFEINAVTGAIETFEKEVDD